MEKNQSQYNEEVSASVESADSPVGEFVDAQKNQSSQAVDKRSGREKLLVGLMMMVAISAVIVGYARMANLQNHNWLFPLANTEENETQSVASDAFDDETMEMMRLQGIDTDGDGLSDYEEIYIYKTSPYLVDTDGDGFTDKEEIDSGNDPLCPAGQNCFRPDAPAPSSQGGGITQAPPTGNIVDVFMSGGASPDMVREVLLQGGMSQDDVALLSDQDVMLLYQEFLSGSDSEAIGGGSFTPTPTPTPSGGSDPVTGIDSIEDLQNLSGAQIRALLIEQGAPADELNLVDDDQLKQLFLEQIAQEASNY